MQHPFIENTEQYLKEHLPSQPRAIQNWRNAHWTQFLMQGIPNQRMEAWKYTNIMPLFKMNLATDAHENALMPNRLPIEHHAINILNGKMLLQENIPEGLQCLKLSTNPEQVLPYLIKDHETSSILNDVNAALADEVILIQISEQYPHQIPLVLDHYISEKEKAESFYTRLILDIQTNAQVTLIQRFSGLGQYAQNTVTDIRIAANAQVQHTVLQQESEIGIHTHTIFAKCLRDSQYHAFSLALGARLARIDWFTDCAEKNAKVKLDGLFIIGKHQHIDHHTRIDHSADYTESDQLYKGILKDHGIGVFEGKVIVPPKVQKINAAQTNHNLLLCEQAEMNTKPELQIYSDDVKCAHGATIGRLNADAMFYLQARGFSEQMARDYLTLAFAQDALQRLPEAHREFMKTQVMACMPSLNEIVVEN